MKNSVSLIYVILLFSSCVMPSKTSQLSRYKAANEQLLKTEAPHEVVLMGNSITDSWPDMRPDFFKETGYIGRGIGGQTTPQMVDRFKQDVIQLTPKVVVILAGTNDIAGNTGPMTLDETVSKIGKMVTMALKKDIRVVIASVLPAKEYTWAPGKQPDVKIPLLNQKLKALSAEYELVYLDYFSVMVDEDNGLQERLTYDGVHPDEEGYQVMEPLLQAAIAKAMNL